MADLAKEEVKRPVKRRHRRTAVEIERSHPCTFQGCTKAYGSESSLSQHVRLKHSMSMRARSRSDQDLLVGRRAPASLLPRLGYNSVLSIETGLPVNPVVAPIGSSGLYSPLQYPPKTLGPLYRSSSLSNAAHFRETGLLSGFDNAMICLPDTLGSGFQSGVGSVSDLELFKAVDLSVPEPEPIPDQFPTYSVPTYAQNSSTLKLSEELVPESFYGTHETLSGQTGLEQDLVGAESLVLHDSVVNLESDQMNSDEGTSAQDINMTGPPGWLMKSEDFEPMNTSYNGLDVPMMNELIMQNSELVASLDADM